MIKKRANMGELVKSLMAAWLGLGLGDRWKLRRRAQQETLTWLFQLHGPHSKEPCELW